MGNLSFNLNYNVTTLGIVIKLPFDKVYWLFRNEIHKEFYHKMATSIWFL